MAAAQLEKVLPKTAHQLDTVGSTTAPRSQQPMVLSAHEVNKTFSNTPQMGLVLSPCGTTKGPGGAGWALTSCPALQTPPS